MIYRADAPGLIRTGVRWLGLLSLGWMYSGLTRKRPSRCWTTLQALLGRVLDFGNLQSNLERGALSALAITASGYTSGEHLTFYQAHRPIEPWHRYLRLAIPTDIGIDHLMASSAIPFVFPARRVDVPWQGRVVRRWLHAPARAHQSGDSSGRASGAGGRHRIPRRDPSGEPRGYAAAVSALAQVGGHALSSIFLDGLSADVERLERINQLMEHAVPDGQDGAMRRIRVLSITPSQSLDLLALEHLDDMPAQARALFAYSVYRPIQAGPGRRADVVSAIRIQLHQAIDRTGLCRYDAA